MEFRQCTVGGLCYGGVLEAGETFQDAALKANLTSGHPSAPVIHEFLTLLATCHTVVPEARPGDDETVPGRSGSGGGGGGGVSGHVTPLSPSGITPVAMPKYQASSPDEEALVKGAAKLG